MANAKPLVLSSEDHKWLETIVRTRTLQAQVVTRARILLLKEAGDSVDAIAEKVDLNRNSVLLCLKKYKAGGVENAIYDAPGRGRNAQITDDEKAWIINVACQKPKEYGYSAETWTYAKLTAHINKTAENAGYTRLSTITKTSIKNILDAAKIKPFRIQYYCENRDPNSSPRCIRFCMFTSRLRCSLMKTENCTSRLASRIYTRFHMMKSPEFRPLLLLHLTYRQIAIMEQSNVIMNTSVLAPSPFWQPLIF